MLKLSIHTMIKEIKAKSILSSRKDPDPWFGCKYNMNLYRGCEHRCIYCDSRSECYRIENFEDVLVKANAIDLLRDELPRKRIKGSIGFGAMSDPYTFAEKKYRLTRKSLKVIAEYKFPIHMLTKSDMVLEDLEILREISKEFAAISFTVTTGDDDLASKVEPHAPRPSERFKAMKKLADAGIYTGVTMMPILPFIEDTEENFTDIVKQCKDHGGQYIIGAIGMTLRDRQREYYYKKLDEDFPGVKQKYIDNFGYSYSVRPLNHKRLQEAFLEACEKYGIETEIEIYEPRKVGKGEQPRLLEA